MFDSSRKILGSIPNASSLPPSIYLHLHIPILTILFTLSCIVAAMFRCMAVAEPSLLCTCTIRFNKVILILIHMDWRLRCPNP